MIKVRKALATVLVAALLVPAMAVAQPQTDGSTTSDSSGVLASGRQRRSRTNAVRRSRTVRRSAEEEGTVRRRHHISKGEVAMMAAVAGTSMGIGAIAAGGTGLAIGALVGGWSAYAVHRLWRHIR
jgi:hypothetical protein